MRRVFGWLVRLASLAGWGYFELSLLRLLLERTGIHIDLPFKLAKPGNVPPGSLGLGWWPLQRPSGPGWDGRFSASKHTAEYVTRSGEAGTMVITRSTQARREAWGQLVRWTFIELGFFAWIAANKTFPREFVFYLGIACVLATIGYFYEQESWHVAPNAYEHRRAIFGWTYWRRRIAGGALIVKSYVGSHDLLIRDPRGRRKLATSSRSKAEIETYGELVARETGWELER